MGNKRSLKIVLLAKAKSRAQGKCTITIILLRIYYCYACAGRSGGIFRALPGTSLNCVNVVTPPVPIETNYKCYAVNS